MTDIYVDFDATTNGDGTTPAKAMNTLDNLRDNTSNGDRVWIRRASAHYDMATKDFYPGSYRIIIGWPKAGQSYYEERPQAGKSAGWDADPVEQKATLYTNNRDYQPNLYGTAVEFVNIKVMLDHDANSPSYAALYCSSGNRSSFDNIEIAAPEKESVAALYLSNCFDFRINGLSGKVGTRSASFDINSSHNLHITDIDMEFVKLYGGCVIDTDDCEDIYMGNLRFTGQLPNNYNNTKVCDLGGSNITVNGLYFDAGCPNTWPTREFRVYAKNSRLSDIHLKDKFGDANFSIIMTGANDHLQIAEVDRILKLHAFSSRGLLQVDQIHHYRTDTEVAVNYACTLITKGLKVLDKNVDVTSGVWYSMDHGGISGYLKCWFPDGVGESSVVTRTGGAAWSMRCERKQYGKAPLRFGIPDKAELFWVAVENTKTITLYGAYKDVYPRPLRKQDIQLEVEYKDGSGILCTLRSDVHGQLETDNSSWNGDDNLVPFKVTLKANFGSAQNIPVRVIVNPEFQNSAYLYFDPAPKVTA